MDSKQKKRVNAIIETFNIMIDQAEKRSSIPGTEVAKGIRVGKTFILEQLEILLNGKPGENSAVYDISDMD